MLVTGGLRLQYLAGENSRFTIKTPWEPLKVQPGSRMEMLSIPSWSPCTHWHPVPLAGDLQGGKLMEGVTGMKYLYEKKQKSYLAYVLLEIIAH